MKIKFSNEYLKYTNGLIEIEVEGKTVGDCVDTLLNRFPQLYIHWMDNQAEEGKKSAFYLNGDFIWESESVKLPVKPNDVLEVTKGIPNGSGAIGKIIAGVVLIIVGVVVAYLSSWTGIGAKIGFAIAMMGAGMLMGGIGELIVGTPAIPTLGDFGSSGSNTPTYSFSGIRNTTTVGTPLGLVYGTHRVGGQLLNIYTDIEGTDTYLYSQIGLCEGEVAEINDVEVNKDPISYYHDVTYDYRLGASTQSIMPWFTRTENSVALNKLIGAEAATYDTSKIVDAVKVIVSAPTLYYTNPTVGLQSTSVTFNIYFKKSSEEVFTLHSTRTLTGQTKSETLGEYLLELPSSDFYQIKVERTTALHSSDLNYGDTIYLKTVNEINYDQFSYPCTAMLGLKIRATEQLSGSMPTITSLVKGQKILIPNNYDPVNHTYSSQAWDGTFASTKQWSDNPVWCLYDLLTNKRYGLGDYYRLNPINLPIIKAQFYLMARYCDELVNGEPRYTLNLVIDSSKPALEWVQTITSIMQANLYYSEGMLWIDINRPKPITQLFNMSNIIAGSYSQQGTSYKKIPNVYEVQWPNPDHSYEYSMFRIENMDLQAENIVIEERKAAMNLVGVTRYSHARRLAKYALLVGRTNKKTISFKTATNALQCMVTDVIGIQHDVPQWGYGSRIVSYDETSNSIIVGNDIEFNETSTYEIQIAHKGQEPKTYSCALDASNSRLIYLHDTPNPIPEKDDIYIIGETSYSVKPFMVLSIKDNEKGEIEVVATEYNESIYTAAEDLTDQSQVLIHNYSSLQSPSKVSVADFKANEKIYIANDGTIKSGIECFFTPQNSTLFWDSAVINYSIEGNFSWQHTQPNKSGYVFIPDLTEGLTYSVVATSVYKDGSRQSVTQALADESNKPYSTVMLLGKTAPPANVKNFKVTQNPMNNNYLKFSWTPVSDIDLSHYEIRKGNVWELGEIVKDYIKETYYNEFFVKASANYEFMIKAVDTSGNYSEDFEYVSLYAQVEPQTVGGFSSKQVGSSVLLTWNANPELDILGYTVREGESWEASMVIVDSTPNTNFTLNGIANKTYKFWIKAIDLYGSKSIYPAYTICNVANVPLPNIYLTFDESGDNWPGIKDNVTVTSGHLSLPSVNVYDSGKLYDSGLTYDFFIKGIGYYTTQIYELSNLMNCNIIFDYNLTIGSNDVFKIEIATTDGTIATWDDKSLWDSGANWEDTYVFSDWVPFTGGYITAKAFKLRLTLLNASNLLSVTTFKTIVDVPDVTTRGSGISVPVEGLTINFPHPYYAAPSVNITVIGSEGYPRMLSKSNENFVVKVYNSNNVAIAGTIDWVANGY